VLRRALGAQTIAATVRGTRFACLPPWPPRVGNVGIAIATGIHFAPWESSSCLIPQLQLVKAMLITSILFVFMLMKYLLYRKC